MGTTTDLERLGYASDSEEFLLAGRISAMNAEKGSLKDLYCPVCNNKGFYYDVCEKPPYMTVKDCKCKAKRECVQHARESGMGGTMLQKSFENFDVSKPWQKSFCDKVKTYAEKVVAGDNGWLAVLGQSGIGKSHLCLAAANMFLDKSARVIYMTWNNAVKEMKRNATDDEKYSTLFDRYATADVLYIDDLFKGKVTETDVTIAFELINRRYLDETLVTIISSELLLSDLLKIDEAIAGRIMERAGDNIIQIKKDPSKNYRTAQIPGLI